MRRAMSLTFALALSSCSRNEIDPAFVGTFELISRDGRPLPAVLQFTQDSQKCTNEMLNATLTIWRNGKWTESYRARRQCGLGGSALDEINEREEHGSASHPFNDRGMLVLTSVEAENEGFEQTATVERDELRMHSAVPAAGIDIKFVYRRISQ
jgi:hypothetical protein